MNRAVGLYELVETLEPIVIKILGRPALLKVRILTIHFGLR